MNLKRCTVLALLAATAAWPAQPDFAAVLRRLNRGVATHPDRTSLRERSRILRQAIISRPDQAAKFLLAPDDAAALQPLAEPDTIETPDSAVASTVLIADSDDWTRSTHVYFAETSHGVITAYQDSARAPRAGCGATFRLDGFRLGDIMLVTDAAVIRAADPQPNCKPVAEHRIAVLMLSLPGLPSLPISAADVRQQFLDCFGRYRGDIPGQSEPYVPGAGRICHGSPADILPAAGSHACNAAGRGGHAVVRLRDGRCCQPLHGRYFISKRNGRSRERRSGYRANGQTRLSHSFRFSRPDGEFGG